MTDAPDAGRDTAASAADSATGNPPGNTGGNTAGDSTGADRSGTDHSGADHGGAPGGEQPPGAKPFTTENVPTGIGQPGRGPHPRPDSLVGSYVYSYDVATPSRPSAAPATRSIPSMRPSYDAEHPVSPTPIYDALYSEYRRLFRALPGDRSGEENMRFTGFAVREPQSAETGSYPQQQAFQTYPGHAHGTPQYMPAQAQQAPGSGWVSAGYLGPAQPASGTGGGRHRSMLSLPPGRSHT